MPPRSSLWSSETWIPTRGRTAICRLAWCKDPAVDGVRQLCADHAGWQPKRTKHDDREMAKQTRKVEVERMLRPPGWAGRASCRSFPKVDFFPGPYDDTGPAIAVCAGCQVRVQCLEEGMGQDYGIWGGTTARERVRLRRAASAA